MGDEGDSICGAKKFQVVAKATFCSSAVYLQGIFIIYLGEREREIWQTFPFFYTSLVKNVFSFLRDSSKHAVYVKQP